jgi:hypothetical protein
MFDLDFDAIAEQPYSLGDPVKGSDRQGGVLEPSYHGGDVVWQYPPLFRWADTPATCLKGLWRVADLPQGHTVML